MKKVFGLIVLLLSILISVNVVLIHNNILFSFYQFEVFRIAYSYFYLQPVFELIQYIPLAAYLYLLLNLVLIVLILTLNKKTQKLVSILFLISGVLHLVFYRLDAFLLLVVGFILLFSKRKHKEKPVVQEVKMKKTDAEMDKIYKESFNIIR